SAVRPRRTTSIPAHHAAVVTAMDTAALGWHQTAPATLAPTPAPARTGRARVCCGRSAVEPPCCGRPKADPALTRALAAGQPSASTPATAAGASDSDTALARI